MSASSQPLLLVGWDGGEGARDAVALAGLLAHDCGYAVRVVHVYPGYETHGLKREAIDRVRARAQATMAELPRTRLRGIDYETHLVQAASPAEGLDSEAVRTGAALIVLGSTHRGTLGRIVPGSVAENLLHGSPCAVAVAPARYAGSAPEHIAVVAGAYDGSPASRAGVDEAVR